MNIAIIGAGASALFAAKRLSLRKDVTVHIYERSQKAGTKLRASGGGKANIFNTDIRGCHYNHPEFMEHLLQTVNSETIRHEFEMMGLRLHVDEEGRVYPATLFATTVLDLLMNGLPDNVTFLFERPVERLYYSNGKWLINSKKHKFDKVILATGSPAGMIEKNRIGYNDYLKPLQLQCVPLESSLSGFRLQRYPRYLFGCRVKAEVSLWQGRELRHRECGEVVFKEDGISGIVVLNCSAIYNRLQSKKGCSVSLNLLYNDDDFNVAAHLKRFHGLEGVLHPKLIRLYNEAPFDLRDLRFDIAGTYDLDGAQVCSGGIALSEIDDDFQLRKHPGLYAMGEILDIDGVCGGYNLFFAFASAYKVTEALTNRGERR